MGASQLVAEAVESPHTLSSLAGRIRSTDPQAHGVPKGREELWRFTPLDRLRGLHDGTFTPNGSVSVTVEAHDGVAVTTLASGDPRRGDTQPSDRVAAQAWVSAEKATLVEVPANAELASPVYVTVRGDDITHAAFGHLIVSIGEHSRAVVIVDHVGSATYADNVDIRIGDGADATVVFLQDWEDDSVHVGHHRYLVGRDARVLSVVVTLGGDLVRLVPSVNYASTGGDAELLGLFFADAGQHLEHRLFVDHDMPHCRSRVLYRGALQGEGAHTVWIGDVLIRPNAVGTDTYEVNRNLLLTEGARADSVPNLEIETGEVVGAGHASATGRFDDEQLFYLQSRGIPEDEARRLVVRGFFHEILRRIGIDEIEARLAAKIEAELDQHLGFAPVATS
jgi:Fe-S cluster assembly protein SufD